MAVEKSGSEDVLPSGRPAWQPSGAHETIIQLVPRWFLFRALNSGRCSNGKPMDTTFWRSAEWRPPRQLGPDFLSLGEDAFKRIRRGFVGRLEKSFCKGFCKSRFSIPTETVEYSHRGPPRIELGMRCLVATSAPGNTTPRDPRRMPALDALSRPPVSPRLQIHMYNSWRS